MAKRIALAALCSLLVALVAGTSGAQNPAAVPATPIPGGTWQLTAVDADGSTARAYLANTATGQSFNCVASYVWSSVTIAEVTCRPFDVTPATTSPNKGPWIPSMLAVNGPQTISLFVWFVNPDTGAFVGCVWNHQRQACKEGEIKQP